MAATIDDLLYVAAAIRVDVRAAVDELRNGGSGGASGGGGAPTSSDAAPRFVETVRKAGAALNSFTSVFQSAMSGMGEQLTKFVKLANPVAVMQFNMAVENAMSALGRVFLPALQRFTILIQQLGNAIESLSDKSKTLLSGMTVGGGLAGVFTAVATAAGIAVKILGGWVTVLVSLTGIIAGVLVTTTDGKRLMAAFGEVLKSVGQVFEAIAPVIVKLISGVLIPVLNEFALVIKHVAEFVADAVALLTGETSGEKYDPNKRTAQAVRQSQITDLRSFANRNYTLAYGGAAADIPAATLAEAKKQSGLLARLVELASGRAEGALVPGPGAAGGGFLERRIGKTGRFLDAATEPFMMGPRFILNTMKSLFD